MIVDPKHLLVRLSIVVGGAVLPGAGGPSHMPGTVAPPPDGGWRSRRCRRR
ncbi:hypothetical protein [Arenibaculum pallidiluteum]|uniref:hypothetical protein n=1 Tax=Arenibaculum pallidiluteum TaxID=2812559 RepID=UPI001A96B45E|nr:hypothetical protein [Arenibaculum pallidiluteum]